MRNILALLILFSSFSLWAQKGNHLETIYFRNPQYVLQMDKMMYPGYEIKFENIQLHEYLNNKKVSTTPLKMPARKITFTDSDGSTSYLRKLKTYPSFEEYIAAVATWTSAVDSNAVDFDQELYDNYRIAWEKTDWEEVLYYVEEPKDFVIETIKEDNEIFSDGNFVPEGFNEFWFDYSARLDENYNIIKENIFIEEIARNDEYFHLKRLLPVKAENLADSLLSNYKKVKVRKRPVYDKKRRPIGTEATAGDVQVYERGYFDVRYNRVILAGRENAYLYIDNSQEIDGKKGTLTINTEHLIINGDVAGEEEYLPIKKPGQLFEFRDEFYTEYSFDKTEISFEDIIKYPSMLEVQASDGTISSLKEVLEFGEETEALWLQQQYAFRSAWENTEIGDVLISPYTIKFVGVSSYSAVKSGLPLVEQLIESRPLREDEAFDADGNVYETTLIGDRRWMKENLRSEHFQDGSEIPNLTTSQWATSTKEGIIIDEYMDVTLANKGHRYNGYTVVSEKNVCPYGFWVPDEDDIAELYNDVTPYNEYIKIKGNGTVKEFRYSPLLAPVVWPVATALNVGWNSIALGADATLLAGAGAIDLTYNTPWFLADLFLLGPILGWEKVIDKTYAKQMKYYKNIQLDSSPYNKPVNIPVNEDGYILKYDYSDDLFLDENGNSIRIQEEDYDNCEMYIEVTDEFGYESLVPTDKPKYKSEWKNPNPNSGVLYNPLPTFKGNGGFHLFRGSFDLLSEVNGLFYYFRSAPYQPKSKDDYGEFEDKKLKLPVKTKSRYLPVIAQLFKKDENLKDNYDFGLEVGNGIDFPNRQAPKSIKKVSYYNNLGLAYKNWELPALWGISSGFRDSYHELNAVPSYYPEDDFKLLKMGTAIRCVNDPFYEAPEDNY
ncbi:fibrobacter succinogenes major paralogous domain-containing protein [Crocinitomicaceae bacterium]|nr:fibrobacter succinogenes major paralogous domain-containing protein [Crocinitomicaceae bacterium]